MCRSALNRADMALYRRPPPGAKILASPKSSEKWVFISSIHRANGDHSSLLFAGVADLRPASPRLPPAPPTLREILWGAVCLHRDKFSSASSKAERRDVAAPLEPGHELGAIHRGQHLQPNRPARLVILPLARHHQKNVLVPKFSLT